MAAKKRTGLGKGISSLIPTAPANERDVDVFFNGSAPLGRAHHDSAEPGDTRDVDATTQADVQEAEDGSTQPPASVGSRRRTASTRTDASAKRSAASTTSATVSDDAQPAVAPAGAEPARAEPAGAEAAAATASQEKTTATRAPKRGTARSTGRSAKRSSARSTTAKAAPRNTSTHNDEAVADDASASVVPSTDPAANVPAAPSTDAPSTAAPSTAVTADVDHAAAGGTATSTDTSTAPDGDTDTSALAPVPGATLTSLDPSRILPNARQPRTEFDQEALDELIVSVREFGVLQPIVVRPLSDDDPRRADGDYELIMGERRLRATKASGRTEIPAVVRHTDDVDMLRDALLENLHRAELNPLEEASAYRQLLDDFGITQEQLAARIGRSRPRISNTLRLLNLPVEVQRKVAAGILSAGHARAVLSVGEPSAMARLADKIINEELSVRQAEAAAAKSSTRVDRSPESSRPAAEGDTLAAHLEDVGERLGDRLNTRVRVALRKTKGQITIDFASVADLHRILVELGEGDAAER